jgi:hypothetical protein
MLCDLGKVERFYATAIKLSPEMQETFAKTDSPKDFDFEKNGISERKMWILDLDLPVIDGITARSIIWSHDEHGSAAISCFDANEPGEMKHHYIDLQGDNSDRQIRTTFDTRGPNEQKLREFVEQIGRICLNAVVYYLSNKEIIPLHPSLRPEYIQSQLTKKVNKADRKGTKNKSLFNISTLDHDWTRVSGGKSAYHKTLEGTVDVRGHWRWQAWGARYSKRRLTWIEPFKKGFGQNISKLTAVSVKLKLICHVLVSKMYLLTRTKHTERTRL